MTKNRIRSANGIIYSVDSESVKALSVVQNSEKASYRSSDLSNIEMASATTIPY